jgi:hypothetical protein
MISKLMQSHKKPKKNLKAKKEGRKEANAIIESRERKTWKKRKFK